MKDFNTDMDESEPRFNDERKKESRRRLIATPFSKVVSRKVDWIWYPFIAKRKIAIFAGFPGKGKSQMLALIAAGISHGGATPDGKAFPCGKVAMLSAEDSADDTIRPRLMAAGANLANVTGITASSHINDEGRKVSGLVRLDEDIDLIGELLADDPTYSLIIIDPISAYLGKVKENSNAELRDLLGRIDELANRHNVAFILNTHLNKNSEAGDVTSRIIGSTAYTAAARMVVIFADHPDAKDSAEDQRMVFQCSKNNLAPKGHGLVYETRPTTVDDTVLFHDGRQIVMSLETCRIEFTGEDYKETADSLVSKKKSHKVDEIGDWLREYLSEGSKQVKDVLAAASSMGYTTGTLYRAKDRIKVIEDYTASRPYFKFWTLPSENTSVP